MQWITPSERDTDNQALERRLWDAADQLRANSGLTSAQYSQPVLGLILRFAEVRFLPKLAALETQAAGARRGSRAGIAKFWFRAWARRQGKDVNEACSPRGVDEWQKLTR